MPSLSHDPTAIEALIISGRSRARLAVRSKPVRLNIRSVVDASVLPSKLWSEARWRFVGAVGSERAVERVEVLSDALEAIGRIW